jgi:hypothetical protein
LTGRSKSSFVRSIKKRSQQDAISYMPEGKACIEKVKE